MQEAAGDDRRVSRARRARCRKRSRARSRRKSASRSGSRATNSTACSAASTSSSRKRRARCATRRCSPTSSGKLEERISHEPLGVVANISAWNYPYFVGANVFVPALRRRQRGPLQALRARDADRHAHREDARTTAGVPDDVFVPVIGDGATGAALLRQPVDGVFFTGSYATGQKIAAAAGRRMIKVQLELGGKDPIYVCDDVDVEGRGRGARRRRVLQQRPVVLRGRAHLRAPMRSTTPFVDAFVAEVTRLQRRRSDGRVDLSRTGDAPRAARRAEAPGRRRAQARRQGADRRQADSPVAATGSRRPSSSTSITA